MVTLRATCILQGKSFSPSSAEAKTGVVFIKKNEVGEIGRFGKYKNKPIPFGSAEIAIDENEWDQNVNEIDYLLETFNKHINIFQICGAENIFFNIDVEYENQCNFDFSTDFIQKLAAVKIPLTISCYEKETQNGEQS